MDAEQIIKAELVLWQQEMQKNPSLANQAVKGMQVRLNNLIPEKVIKLVRLALGDNFSEARQLHLNLYPLFTSLFIETNPIPIKTALSLMGRIKEEFRLPLCTISEKNKGVLIAQMKIFGILG